MFLVGLTGGIASGKSTVAKIFREECGVQVVDADEIARKVVEPGRKAWKRIKQEFGPEITDPEFGEIDRQKLGEIVFTDVEKRRLLNSITHPEIYKHIMWLVIGYFLKGHQFVILDLPLLFESGAMLDYIHKTIVVSCEEDQQLDRLRKRNPELSVDDAKKRIKSQMPLTEKCTKANFVIDNSRSPEDTRDQVLAVHKVLKTSKRHWYLRFLIFAWTATIFLAAVWLFRTFSGNESEQQIDDDRL